MSVSTSERDSERCAVAVDDQMVFGAGTGTVDGRRADVIPPFRARTCDPSTAQSSRPRRSARRSSVSRAACRRDQTPASVQSLSRRQAVAPEQPTVSAPPRLVHIPAGFECVEEVADRGEGVGRAGTGGRHAPQRTDPVPLFWITARSCTRPPPPSAAAFVSVRVEPNRNVPVPYGHHAPLAPGTECSAC